MATFRGLLTAVALLPYLTSCSTQFGQQFEDGIAAMTGKGGTIARADNFDDTVKVAAGLAPAQPKTAWETVFPEEAPDFMQFIDEHRLLIGAVEVGAYLGVPSFKKVLLYDSRTGKKLWEADRPDLVRGQYTVAASEPAVVLFGATAAAAVLIGIDRDSGARRWRHEFKPPVSYALPAQGDQIVVLAAEPAGMRVTAVNLGSGATAWQQSLSRRTGGGAPRLAADDQDVYVLDGSLRKLRGADGTQLWNVELPELGGDSGMVAAQAEGMLVWNERSVAFVDAQSGAVRWRNPVAHGGVKLVGMHEGRVYRVVTPDIKQILSAPVASDTVEALDARTGAVRWARVVEGTLVSGLAFGTDAVFFSTEESVYALRARDGEALSRVPLPAAFREKSPTEFNPNGQPDLVFAQANTLYVSRESAGVAAFSLPELRARWVQGNDAFPYARPARHGLLSASLAMHQIPAPSTPAFQPSYASARPSPQLQAHQQRMQGLERMRTDALKRKDYRTASEVSGMKAAELQGRIGEMQAEFRRQRMEANLALAESIISGLTPAIEGALKAAAQGGLVSRLLLELESSNALQRNAFQNRFHVRPFRDAVNRKARGVTLVNLETGRRSDLVFSPTVEAMIAYGVDLPHVAISPDGERLIAIGVGLRTERYQPYVKFKVRMPRPSVLAYDIASLRFVERNAAIEAATSDQGKPPDAFAELVAAARRGNVLKVRRLLDRGVDPNPKQRTRFAPLIVAAENGFADVVALLVNRGADVNYAFGNRSTVDFAKDPEVRRILLQAGARSGTGK